MDGRKVLEEVKTNAEPAFGESPADVLVYVVERDELYLWRLRFGGGGERQEDCRLLFEEEDGRDKFWTARAVFVEES